MEGPGDLVWRYPMELTEAGSFYTFFKEEKLPTGVYSRDLRGQGRHLATARSPGAWRPTACRASRCALDAPDRVPLDREFKVGLTGIYYAGGRVAGQAGALARDAVPL